MTPYRQSELRVHADEDAARTALTPDLRGDESFLWLGRPSRRVLFGWVDLFLIPFSLAWGGGAIAWESVIVWAAATGQAPIWAAFFGVPFVLVGLYMLVGRFVFDVRRRARTYYAVTNRRILILEDKRSRTLLSIDLETLRVLTTAERGGGTGSIAFGPLASSWGANAEASVPGGSRAPRLQLVPEVARVAETIREARDALLRR